MTPDRETLAAVIEAASARWRVEDERLARSSERGPSRAEFVADALLSGPLAPAPAGDGGLPERVREQAREAVGPAVDRWLNDDADDREFASIVGADAAAEVAYSAGRADERARLVAKVRRWAAGARARMVRADVDARESLRLYAVMLDGLADGLAAGGEHLDD